MKTIGVISDTHGCWDGQLEEFLGPCDELWHAGDIGGMPCANAIAAFRPLRAVHGNIDDQAVRRAYPKLLSFACDRVRVLMVHIGGSPGRYPPDILPIISAFKPMLFICGHSHILRVMFDRRFNMLYVNPGAAGRSGIHTVRTAIRFAIADGDMKDMEVLDLAR